MSNLSKNQFQQLKMFDSAKNLTKLKWGDTRPGETKKDVMVRKLSESKINEDYSTTSNSLHDSIRQHGVLDPVTIVHGIRPKTGKPFSDLAEGHHRVASAHDVNPNMIIPLEHKEPHELWNF
jgi:hypothetical protein